MSVRTTGRQDADFIDEIVVNGLKDVSWVLKWVKDNFLPEDVFDTDDLEAWALENGFVKEED